jgi:hypothetical protein
MGIPTLTTKPSYAVARPSGREAVKRTSMEAVLEGGEAETPSSVETPTVETPSNETPTEAPDTGEQPAASSESPDSSTEEALYELPDGRKVNADALQKEWKENFLPDYTRKSQELAKIRGAIEPEQVKPAQNPWEDPNWNPQSWQEVMDATQARMEAEAKAKADAAQQQTDYIKSVTDKMEEAVKALDPNVDLNAVYAHANKFKIPDLVAAYSNLQELKNVAKTTEERVLKNLKGREADPISTGNGEPGEGGLSYQDVSSLDMATAAQDALRRIKG